MIHFAGLKAVGESVAYPMRYFDNNLIGTINLYKVMTKYNCKKVRLSNYPAFFDSSALFLLFFILVVTSAIQFLKAIDHCNCFSLW